MIATSLYRVAHRFIGVQEVPGAGNSPQVLTFLHLDGNKNMGDDTPWCSAFLNYCAWLLEMPRSRSLAARSWLSIGTAVPLSEASADADVVVLWRGSKDAATGHVGLYSGVDGMGNVYLLGGNQGNAVSVAPFPIERVLGVRRLT